MPDSPQHVPDEAPHRSAPMLSYATPRDTSEPRARSNSYAFAGICLVLFPFVLLISVAAIGGGSPTSGTFATFLLFPLVGVGLGIVGALRARDRRYRGRVSAICAICLGTLQVVWLFLLTTKRSSSEQTRDRLLCASNLRQIGQGLFWYAQTNAGQFPPTLDPLITGDLDIDPAHFVCPASDETKAPGTTAQQQAANFRASPRYCSYIYVPTTLPASAVPAIQVLAYEPLANHEKAGMDVLYADGHVDWLDRKPAEHLISELSSGHNPPRP